MSVAVYEWDAITGKRTGEYVLKNCSYTGVGLSVDGKNIFAVGSDQKLKEITDSQASAVHIFFFLLALSHTTTILRHFILE